MVVCCNGLTCQQFRHCCLHLQGWTAKENLVFKGQQWKNSMFCALHKQTTYVYLETEALSMTIIYLVM
jgi:hypothetical protein